MKKNMGSTDRVVRIILAVILAALFFTNTVTGVLGMVFLVLAGVLLLTSVVLVCPLYLPFGIKTRSTKE
jgi:hypothetical protein